MNCANGTPSALPDATAARKDIYPLSLSLSPTSHLPFWVTKAFEDIIVRCLEGRSPREFVPVLVGLRDYVRRTLEDHGCSKSEALERSEFLHCRVFDDLQRTWENLTRTEG